MADVCNLGDRIFSRLTGDAAVSALVGTRVYPEELPNGATIPAVTYSEVSSNFTHAFNEDPGNVQARYQISYWGKTHSKALAGREAVRSSLSRYRVATGCPTIDDTFVEGQFVFHDDDRREEVIHQAITDFLFFTEVVVVYYPMVTGDNVVGFSLADTGYRFTATGDSITGTTSGADGWVFVSRGRTDTLSRWEFLSG